VSETAQKEMVWVIGSSAAGKETFIRAVTSNDAIAARFGWTDRTIRTVPASTTYIGQTFDDAITERREEILSEAIVILQVADIAIAKWQFVDTTANRLSRLAANMPGVNHRSIILHTDDDQRLKRLINKPWWTDLDAKSFMADEQVMLSTAIKKIPDNFDIIHIDSSAGTQYAPYQPTQTA
jgi:hypothetical protein